MEHSAQDPAPASADTPLIAVVGATATGKSDLAIALARQLDGEVINADALQLYRGMDIGTAKVTPEERAGVPHHLLDVLEVTEEASVSAYQRDAREAIAAIRSRRRTPILVGGSGLYVRAVLDDIEFPPTDAALRERLEQRIAQEGTEALHRELAASDPEAAGIIGPRDARRIVRALEVGALTGRPFTAFLPRPLYADASTVQIGLRRDRALLHERIAEIEKLADVRIEKDTAHSWGLLPYDPRGVELAREVADELGLSHRPMMTIAGHDSTNVKDVVPSVMLFVPSVDGISHNEGEYTTDEDLCAGVRLFTGVAERLVAGHLDR